MITASAKAPSPLSPPSSAANDVNGGAITQAWGGITYYGGIATVIDGTTRWVGATAVVRGTLVGGTATWVSGSPGINGGTSRVVGSTTAAPIVGPTESPMPVNNQSKLSGGAIAGIVLGCLAALALVGLLAWCWRKKRHQHTAVYNQDSTYDNRGPTCTVVTEKIEPAVVKAGTTNYNTSTPGNTTYTTSPTTTPVNSYSTGTNYGSNTRPSTSYNTTTTTNNGYNADAYNSGRNVVDGAQIAANTVYNADHNTADSAYNANRDPSNSVGSGARAAGNAANNAMH
ncbi:hypothetical protein CPB97_002529 [Podila verticillata]|nr:hypothetical protein CPB97_002529 [Podila verticillata]